jgi:hypothetical protein
MPMYRNSAPGGDESWKNRLSPARRKGLTVEGASLADKTVIDQRGRLRSLLLLVFQETRVFLLE